MTNAGVRKGAAQKGNLLQTVQLDIADEVAAPHEMTAVFLAREARADPDVRHLRLLPSGGGRGSNSIVLARRRRWDKNIFRIG
jgi:hypothetical protein